MLAVAVIVVQSVDLNRYKSKIESWTLQQTGRTLDIRGELQATVLPRLGLTLNDVVLANAESFEEANFVTVRTGNVQVEVLPLLLGEFKVQSVVLDGVVLTLQRDADGKTNWDDMMSNTPVVEADVGEDMMQEVEAGAPVVAALSIGSIALSDSFVSYADARDERYLELRGVNLTTDSIVLSEPFAFQAEFGVVQQKEVGNASQVVASGDITVDLAENRYQIQQLSLETAAQTSMLASGALPLKVHGDVSADFNAQTLDLVIDDGDVAGVAMIGELHMREMNDQMQLEGNLRSDEFDLQQLMNVSPTINQQWASLADQTGKFSTQFEQSNDQLRFNELTVQMGDIELDGELEVNNVSTAAVLSGRITSNRFDFSPWVTALGFDLPADALRTVHFETSVRQSGELFALNQLQLQIDDSRIQGDVELANISSPNPPVEFALAVDTINVDRYRSTQSAGSGTANPEETPSLSNDVLPVDKLKSLQLAGEITFEQLTYQQLSLQNVVLPIVVDEGLALIEGATAEAYQGIVHTTLSLDVKSEEPLLSVAGNYNGFDAGAFLHRNEAQPPSLEGTGNVNIDLLARGQTPQLLIDHLNGAVSMRVTEGNIPGFNLFQQLPEFDLSRVTPTWKDDGMSFQDLSMTGIITDSVMQSEDFSLQSSTAIVNGQGGIHLGKREIDSIFKVNLNPNQSLDNLPSVAFSVPVRGKLDDFAADWKTTVLNIVSSSAKTMPSELLTKDIEAQIETEKEELFDRIEKEREEAAESLQESKQKAADAIKEQTDNVEQQIEQKTRDIQDKLEKGLLDGVDKILGGNQE